MKAGALLIAAATMAWCVSANAQSAAPLGGSTAARSTPTVGAASLDARRDIVLAVADPLAPPAMHAGSSLLGYIPASHYGGAGMRAARTLTALQRRYGWRELESWPIKSLNLYCIVLEPAQGTDRDALLEQLAADDRVQLAEPLRNFSVYSGPASAPHRYNDPYVSLERGFNSTDAARAHAYSRGKGVDIAVVDTGVDTRHPDLRGQLRGVYNEVDQNAETFDGDHHGTEVAGIIAAIGNNHIGIVGMAPEATLSIYKACWYPPESGADARCNSFTLAKALAAVLDNSDARIVNLSLGGPADPLLAMLLEKLLKQNRVVVAAMPPDGDLDGFPVEASGVIVVRTSGASRAPLGVLSAPGLDILTTQPDGGYDFSSGSSMAAAHVSGIAALLVSLAPDLGGRAIHDLLMHSSRVVDGSLEVNAAAAVAALRNPALALHD
ncbi:MAG TPA: S8 family serine peptidase [Rhodanobacteraceae bacterium]|nr:S8 family serine peptidase [Rhodanobacteraceae bacterium]